MRVALGIAVPAFALATTIGPSANEPAQADVVVAAPQAGTPGGEIAGGGTGDPAPDRRAARGGPLRFAAVDGVNLFVTSPTAKIVAFHQASYADALRMLPIGNGLAFDNGAVDHVSDAGPNFVVMGSRGRPTPATSAVDIAQEPGADVVAPVSGTVTDVRSYALYGTYPDVRIEIAPDGRPDLRVVMLHVSGAAVGVGQQVEAGVTPVAAEATHFPFVSHVDGYAGGRPPHVHIEVKRA